MRNSINEQTENLQREALREGLKLADRYKEYIGPVTESYKRKNGKSLPDSMKSTLSLMLENHRKYLASMDETTRAINVGNFSDYGYKLITAVLPNLVTDRIASIQPLKVRSGEIFFYNLNYGKTKGKITAGQSALSSLNGMALNEFYSSENIEDETIGTGNGSTTTYSGINLSYTPIKPGTLKVVANSITGTDNGTGGITGTGITSGTINYSNGAISITYAVAPSNGVSILASYSYDMEQNPSQIGDFNIHLDQTTVQAQPHKLRASYSLDAAYDFQQVHGMNIDDELVAQLGSIIKAEMDAITLRDIRRQAGAGAVSFDAAVPVGITRLDHYDAFQHTLAKASQLIYKETKLISQATFIVGGVNVYTVVQQMRGFKSAGRPSGGLTGPYVAGTINDLYEFIVNPFYGDNEFVVGFKGDSYLYSGYIFAPYRPLYVTPPIMLDDMYGRRGMFTSAGRKMVNNKFYVTGTITNYS